MRFSHYSKVFALTAIASALLTACNSDSNDSDNTASNNTTKPSMPTGIGAAQSVSLPAINGTAVVDGNIPVTNYKKNIVAYDQDVNPILQILNGFDGIWTQGDTTWGSTGSSNGDVATGYGNYTGVTGGATNSTNLVLQRNFNNAKAIDQDIWQYNFEYVKTLTRPGETTPDVDRSDAKAQVFAYLDDQRHKGYSITSGLGALAEDYRTGANSTSPFTYSADGTKIFHNGKAVDIFNANKLIVDDLGRGTNYGASGHDLDKVVKLLDLIRDHGASTEAPKYHFDSPRPWRIENDYSVAGFTDKSDLTALECYDVDGNLAETKYYDFPKNPLVSPIDGLKCAGRTTYTDNGDDTFSSNYDGNGDWVSGRAKDGGFPSGHTTEAIDRGLGMAYAIPERFAEMAARAVDLGTNRIVAGMHSPLDVIGGRIMGTAVTAAALNAEPQIAADAVTEARAYFDAKAAAKSFDSIYDYAQSEVTDIEAQRYSNHDEMKARYRAALTYGFEPLDEATKAPEVPKGAEVLLASRLPYLNAEQRRAVLATTQIDSNYPIIKDSRGWGRLDLVMAADGYGAFEGDVSVYMDQSKMDFHAKDIWRNDISGQGMLTKDGSGQLTLTGSNTYSGGTLLKAGTLVATNGKAFGTGTLYQQDGTINIAIEKATNSVSEGALTVSAFTQEGGTLALDLTKNANLSVSKTAYLSGKLALTVPTLTTATQYTVVTANTLDGTFSAATAKDASDQSYTVQLDYSTTGVTVTVSPNAG